MLSITNYLAPVRVPTSAGPRAPRVPRLVSSGVGLWVGLVLLLFLAPCALAAPLTLAWDASAGATGYIIHYGTASRNYTATADRLTKRLTITRQHLGTPERRTAEVVSDAEFLRPLPGQDQLQRINAR
jgi:hypothetical protein